MNKGVQEFHRKLVLTPADKADSNIVVVWTMFYINNLKQELSTAKTYGHTLLDERFVDRNRFHMAAEFGVFVNEGQSKLPMLYWFPKFHKIPISHVLLLILAHLILLSYL